MAKTRFQTAWVCRFCAKQNASVRMVCAFCFNNAGLGDRTQQTQSNQESLLKSTLGYSTLMGTMVERPVCKVPKGTGNTCHDKFTAFHGFMDRRREKEKQLQRARSKKARNNNGARELPGWVQTVPPGPKQKAWVAGTPPKRHPPKRAAGSF